MATSIWRARRGPMAPKPKPARFEFTVGMVLAMALTILAVMTWADRDLAAPSSSAVYHPQLLLLYSGVRKQPRGLNVEPAWLTPMIAPEDSSAPSAALLRSSERCRFLINRVSAPTRRASAPARRGRDLPRGGAPILVEAVTRRSAVRRVREVSPRVFAD